MIVYILFTKSSWTSLIRFNIFGFSTDHDIPGLYYAFLTLLMNDRYDINKIDMGTFKAEVQSAVVIFGLKKVGALVLDHSSNKLINYLKLFFLNQF